MFYFAIGSGRVDEQMVVLFPRLDQIPGTVVEHKAVLSRARLRVVNGVADGNARARAFEDRQLAGLHDKDAIRDVCG